MKTFTIISTISMVLTIMVAALSIIGIVITGFYPGIIVLFLLPFVPITSKFYAKNRLDNKSNYFQKNYYTTLTTINLLTILIVLWMTFVILHDRVLKDCC
jgi:hypothetical protein